MPLLLEVLFPLAKPPRRINHPNARVPVGSLSLLDRLPSSFPFHPEPLNPTPPFPATPALTVKRHGHARMCAATKSGTGNAGLIRLESS